MRRTLPRRDFVRLAATGALASWVPTFGRPTNPDVVIVGAGAAGLAAARELSNRGRTFMVVEASDQVGGRAKTDTSIFGVPYDLGAHYLHSANQNPFKDYAMARGFDVYPDGGGASVFVGDRPATPQENGAFQSSLGSAYSALVLNGLLGRDVSAESVMPNVNDWDATTDFTLGPYSVGVDLEDYSVQDWWNALGGPDWFCSEGYGAVVADFGRSIPVELGTRVERIDWSGGDVEVRTSAGTILTRAVILTVSLGVLQSGAIEITPSLPVSVQDAIGRMPMSAYERVALQFSENVLGVGADHVLLFKADSRETAGTLANVSGTSLTSIDFGGSFAKELQQQPESVAVDFALDLLAQAFGSSVREKLVASHASRWTNDPNVLGGWAMVEPGHYSARRTLRDEAAIGDRLFLSGEALHPNQYSTVAGAGLMGTSTAEQVDRVLDGRRYRPLRASRMDTSDRRPRSRAERFVA